MKIAEFAHGNGYFVVGNSKIAVLAKTGHGHPYEKNRVWRQEKYMYFYRWDKR